MGKNRLRKTANVLLYGACYYSGLMKLGRWLIRCSGPRLIILNYHQASGGDLRSHLLHLRRHFHIMHFEVALEELYTPCMQKRLIHGRPPSLVLTFDDGYHDTYTHAFALARELQIPITVFLIPGYIESGQCFWWLEGERLLRHTQEDEATIEGRTYRLQEKEERQALLQAIYNRAKYAKSVSEREMFLTKVREELAVPPAALANEVSVLTWAEIREMKESGWVSFGGHTMHHPVLGYLDDVAEVQREISECYNALEQQLGHHRSAFAYPLGMHEHIGEEALRIVRESSYKWAVTTNYGMNTPQTDPYLLQRISCDVRAHWLIVAADTAGIARVFRPLIRYIKGLLS